jgi:hypothetical protein
MMLGRLRRDDTDDVTDDVTDVTTTGSTIVGTVRESSFTHRSRRVVSRGAVRGTPRYNVTA